MSFDIAQIALPVRFRLEQPMSDEELLQFCAANDALRVEREPDGEIVVMSPANSRTSRINARICRFLTAWADDNHVGVSFDSSGGFRLPDGSVRSPDAAWVSRSRWNSLTDAQQGSFPPICPDFVIELRSPSDPLAAAQAKMEMWIASGASEAWLIDPERTEVSVYKQDGSIDQHHDPSSVQAYGAMSGFELVMANVWR